MKTLTLKYKPSFKNKLMDFLNSFDDNEVQIIEEIKVIFEDEAFINHKKKLRSTLKRIDSGESKMHSLEELDEYLEKIISKYEN